MPIIPADQAKPAYDVVIVGSGAAGGSRPTRSRSRLQCVMLEAGRNYDVVSETPMFNTFDQAPLLGEPTHQKPFGFYDATVGGGWEVPGEPYTNAPGTKLREDSPGGGRECWADAPTTGAHLAPQRTMTSNPARNGLGALV